MEERINPLTSNDCQSRIGTDDVVKGVVVHMEWSGEGFLLGDVGRNKNLRGAVNMDARSCHTISVKG